MITEITTSIIMIAHLAMVGGGEVVAYGDQYPDMLMCQKDAAIQEAAMNDEIRDALKTTVHPMFEKVRIECRDLRELEVTGAVDKGEFDHE